MKPSWKTLYEEGYNQYEAARIMDCSVKTAKLRLESEAHYASNNQAYLRRQQERLTSLENHAYAAVSNCGQHARVPLNDRLPQRVGMNDRPCPLRQPLPSEYHPGWEPAYTAEPFNNEVPSRNLLPQAPVQNVVATIAYCANAISTIAFGTSAIVTHQYDPEGYLYRKRHAF